jgi:hypothetical protein
VPSNAFTGHLLQLLADADHLDDAHGQLPAGIPGRPNRRAAICRAIVIVCVSAWEAYVEELVRECLTVLRPPVPPLGVWPALNAAVRAQIGRFNTPSADNVRMLISDVIGLQNVQHHWTWRNNTSAQAVTRLGVAMELRHQIAHGVNPRPGVSHFYASQLPDFFRRLGRATDRAVRQELVAVHGIANPWPP